MKDPNHLVFASLFYLLIGNGQIFIEETLQHTMTTKRRNLGTQVLYYTSNTKRKSAKEKTYPPFVLLKHPPKYLLT